jgi:hypothetical protein
MDGNRAVRKDHELLWAALERLEGCLVAPLDGYAQSWAMRVGWQLADVATALDQAHGTVDQDLETRIQNLRQELQAVAQPFADSPKIIDLLEIRRRIRLLVSDIQRSNQDVAISLWDNV